MIEAIKNIKALDDQGKKLLSETIDRFIKMGLANAESLFDMLMGCDIEDSERKLQLIRETKVWVILAGTFIDAKKSFIEIAETKEISPP